MVSLPHQWVKENKIEKGDEVEIEAKGTALEISAGKKEIKKEKKECSIEIDYNYEKVLRMQLNNLYRLGYDRIHISYKNKKIMAQVREIVPQYLLGFEIVQEGENHCIIESLTEPTPERAEALLRKMFFIVMESFDILLQGMKERKFERQDEFHELMVRVDRFCNFYSRTLFKEKHLNSFLWSIAQQLLKTEHGLYYCYKAIRESSCTNFSKEVMEYIEKSCSIVRAVEACYYKRVGYDVGMEMERIVKLRDDLLYNQLHKLQKTKEGILVAPHLFDILKQIPIGRTFGLESREKEAPIY